MLKFEEMSVFDDTGLTSTEMSGPAIAHFIANGSTIVAEGECEIVECSNGNRVAKISASGNNANDIMINSPNDLAISCFKMIERTYEVTANQATLDTEVKHLLDAFDTNGDSVAASIDENGTITFIDAAKPSQDGELTLTLKVEIADASASDPNVSSGNALVIDSGEIHFNVISRVSTIIGLKPEETSLTVRGARPWVRIGEDGPIHLS